MTAPRGERERIERLLASLREVLADADALFAGWSCPASTECCRFGVTGREPYVTSIEALALTRAIAQKGGLSAITPARPLAEARDASDAPPQPKRLAMHASRDRERRCPLLDASGRCAAYDARPLGCRTFYCDRADRFGSVKQRDINELVRRIKDIAAAHEPEGDLGRPLTSALQQRLRGPSRAFGSRS